MTGRHMTVRVDGNSIDHMAFGGPIFHGHAASGFNEKAGHPGNIFWPQALEANKVFEMLDGKQRRRPLVAQTAGRAGGRLPRQGRQVPRHCRHRAVGRPEGAGAEDVQKLLEPYRKEDQDEVLDCLKKQGGLDKCSLAFYTDGDLGDDGVWDNWRLEGPSFVWYFRGSPHVHMWVNVGADPSVKLNA